MFTVRHRRYFGRRCRRSFQLLNGREDVREGLQISRDHRHQPIGREKLGRIQQMEVSPILPPSSFPYFLLMLFLIFNLI